MKPLIPITEFNTYSGNFESDDDAVALKTNILNAAQSVVENYLGYSLREDEYTETLTPASNGRVYVHSRPITELTEIVVDDVKVSPDYFTFDEDHIDGDSLKKGCKVKVSYTAGDVKPDPLVKVTVLRIATLMLTESNGNIGMSGKAFPDNSRSFISYSNYDKYLSPLRPLRSFEL